MFQEFKLPELDDSHHSELSDGEDEDEGPDTVLVLRAELDQLRPEVEEQKGWVRKLRRLNCEQLAEMDTLLLANFFSDILST